MANEHDESLEAAQHPQVMPDDDTSEHDFEAIRDEVEAINLDGWLAEDEAEGIVLRYLRRRQQVLTEITRIEEQTQAMIRTLKSKLDGLDYVYEGTAQAWTANKIAGTKKKSHKTPFATLGFRAQPPRLVVDDDEKVIAWAEREGKKDLVRIKKEVAKTALNEYVEGTGEVPVGCSVAPAGNKFYIK